MVLARWKILELAAFFVERALRSERSGVSVEYDVVLPDKVTGDPRRFEILVRSSDGRREFLRSVEVQRRKRRVGAPELSEWADKASRTGIHRVTVVSQAGFSRPALRRVQNEPALFDAVQLRPARAREVPDLGNLTSISMADDTRGVPLGEVPLEPWLWLPLSEGAGGRVLVLLGTPTLPQGEAVIALILPAQFKPGEPMEVSVHAFSRGGQLVTRFSTADPATGRRQTVRLRRR